MKLVERILIATDFTPAADDAVRTAAFAATQFKSDVFLLHVNPDSVDSCSGRRLSIDQQIADRLQIVAEDLRLQGVPQIRTIVGSGSVSDQIVRHADEWDVNVIVIGAGQANDGGQVCLGSTAGTLRRMAAKPVWMVKPGTPPATRSILCPVDFSTASSRALKNAIHLARRFRAKLTVLTVTPSRLSSQGDGWGWQAAADDLHAPQLPREFARFLTHFDFQDVSWTALARAGKPQREILAAAADTAADLLVMGSVGRSGLSRMLIGGVARKVAQHLPCSIITVRSAEPIRLRTGDVARMDARLCAARSEDDICPRFRHGQELLELGFPEKAISHFQDCVAEYAFCPRAWRNLAVAHIRLGRQADAQRCEQRAEQIEQRLVHRQVEAEVRGYHLLYRPMFGIK